MTCTMVKGTFLGVCLKNYFLRVILKINFWECAPICSRRFCQACGCDADANNALFPMLFLVLTFEGADDVTLHGCSVVWRL